MYVTVSPEPENVPPVVVQATLVFEVPVIVAVKLCVCPGVRCTEPSESEMAIEGGLEFVPVTNAEHPDRPATAANKSNP